MEETRVSKYKEYRREISEMSSEDDLTTKKMTSQRVSKYIKKDHRDTSNTLSLNEVMGAYEIYNHGELEEEKPPFESFHKRKALYIASYAVIALILIVGLIVTGILYFGGK